HRCAVDHETGAEREGAAHPAAVLELHHELSRDLLDPGDRAGETGGGLLDDQAPGGGDLPARRTTTMVGGRTMGQSGTAVPAGDVSGPARYRTPVANAYPRSTPDMRRIGTWHGRVRVSPGQRHADRRPRARRRGRHAAQEVSDTDARKLHILGAIVEDYVATREPVGSKSLLERHELGVSAATVRNDMSLLEEEGLIHQPHTSAGRVPTDKGYRTFVARVAAVTPLSAPERRAIRALLEDAGDVEELLSRTVRLLAQTTQQVAMVQYPARRQARIRHVELVK